MINQDSLWQRALGAIRSLVGLSPEHPQFSTRLTGKLTLSRYFPRGTEYFYGYPAGNDSRFFNPTFSWRDELASARPMVIAGPTVSVVVFATVLDPELWVLMTEELGITLPDLTHIIALPKTITNAVRGKRRNDRIKRALKERTHEGAFMMAQPYLGLELEHQYLIAPTITSMLNDKQSLDKFVPVLYRPRHYVTYADGAAFLASKARWPFPCVVKVASSAGGDGVRICYNRDLYQETKRLFRVVRVAITVEEFVLAKQNLGVLFGVPQDHNYPVEILGHHLQVTTDQGEFLGAVFNLPSSNEPPSLPKLYEVLSNPFLARVRALGWYGIGGVDVLFDQRDRFYIIDGNFRVTGATSFSLYLKNEGITTPLLAFTGMFRGSLSQFKQQIVPLAKPGKHRELLIISLTRSRSEVRFNAGVFFESEAELVERVNKLRSLGIESVLLQKFEHLDSLRNLFTTGAVE